MQPNKPENLKILVLSSKFPYPLKDGGAIATYNLIEGLSAIGNKVDLLTFNTKKHFFNPNNFPKNKIPSLNIHTVEIDTSPKIIQALINLFFSNKPYILERFNNARFKSKLRNLLVNNRFGIIQIEGLYLLQYIPFINKKSPALVAYRAHNIEHEIWSNLSKNKSNILLQTYLKILSTRIKKYEQAIINQYDLLVPISNNDAYFFKKLGNDKPVHVCPTGFKSSPQLHISNIECNKDIYFIGSLDWQPNREAVLWFIEKCWFELKKLHPDIKFFVAGRNAPDSFEKKLNHKDIIYEGEVENADKFISDKKIMIVPLLSGSGMRIKIIEAFLMKKAVVSSKLGATGTKSVDNSNIMIADTAKEFVNKISLLLNNSELYKKIISNASKIVSENFDTFEISKSLAKFYQQESKKQKIDASTFP